MKMAILILSGILFFCTSVVLAQGEDKGKVADGIRAKFKVTPSMSMVDVFLSDAKTGKEITTAKVMVMIKAPDGKAQEKELMGMRMTKEYSFGNTADLSKKGKYSFDILAEVDKKKVRFNFDYEVR